MKHKGAEFESSLAMHSDSAEKKEALLSGGDSAASYFDKMCHVTGRRDRTVIGAPQHVPFNTSTVAGRQLPRFMFSCLTGDALAPFHLERLSKHLTPVF